MELRLEQVLRLPRQASAPPFSCHFNQVEELFLRLPGEFSVPALPIHHDVRNPEPEAGYLESLREVLDQLSTLAPTLLAGLSYLFDPAEVLRPAFFELCRVEKACYLYLLRLDLTHRPRLQRVLHRGSNDYTAAYAGRELFLEAALIPLRGVPTQPGRHRQFLVDQTISDTWVGERGWGYFTQGIWMDRDLTKFFSRLFLPIGARTYPFYPYVCRYKTVCQNVIRFGPKGRCALLPYLHSAIALLRPAMAEIEASLRTGQFSEQDETFLKLKSRVPEAWTGVWGKLRVESYLNDQDMKEYRIVDPAG
jgi:hypothetical protein